MQLNINQIEYIWINGELDAGLLYTHENRACQGMKNRSFLLDWFAAIKTFDYGFSFAISNTVNEQKKVRTLDLKKKNGPNERTLVANYDYK